MTFITVNIIVFRQLRAQTNNGMWPVLVLKQDFKIEAYSFRVISVKIKILCPNVNSQR